MPAGQELAVLLASCRCSGGGDLVLDLEMVLHRLTRQELSGLCKVYCDSGLMVAWCNDSISVITCRWFVHRLPIQRIRMFGGLLCLQTPSSGK